MENKNNWDLKVYKNTEGPGVLVGERLKKTNLFYFWTSKSEIEDVQNIPEHERVPLGHFYGE